MIVGTMDPEHAHACLLVGSSLGGVGSIPFPVSALVELPGQLHPHTGTDRLCSALTPPVAGDTSPGVTEEQFIFTIFLLESLSNTYFLSRIWCCAK